MNRASVRKDRSSSGTDDPLDMTELSGSAGRKSSPPAAASKRRALFEDDASSSTDDDSEDGGAQLGGEAAGFKINEEYARRFEHNKKREERQRLEEKYGKKEAGGDGEGSDSESGSSSDETEDEAGFLLTEELDAQMSAALQAIRNKDPRIYEPDTTFYVAPEDSKEEATDAKKSKEKPMFLRDYHRERLMQGDIGREGEEEGGDEQKPKTYLQEQDELKKSLVAELNAATAGDEEEESDEDGFIKKKEDPERGANGVHPSRAANIEITELDVVNADKDPELFLSNFMASRAWVPKDGTDWQAFESDEGEYDDEKADEYEVAYNLRFEDPEKSNEVLRSYSRTMAAERSVRREEKKGRKRRRELEKEKKEAEKKQRHEERARLRKLKIEEAEQKLEKIKKTAGLSGKALNDEEWVKFLEDAWEDDKWEEEMKKRFGDQYYAEVEGGAGGSDSEGEGEGEGEGAAVSDKKKKPKKPKWDDDIDIKDIVPDFEDEVARPNITLTDDEANEAGGAAAAEEDDDGDEDEDEDEEDQPRKKQKTSKDHKKDRAAAKRAARIERSKIEALVDAQMELDNPTALASASSSSGRATAAEVAAFRYRETSPNSFGLTARDILLAPSDAALNEFAGLKKLATFRDPEKKRKDRKKLGKKARLRQWRCDNFGPEFEHTGPTYGLEGRPKGQGREQEEERKKSKKKKEGKDKKKADEDGGARVVVEEEEAKEGGAEEEKAGKRKRKRSKGGKAGDA